MTTLNKDDRSGRMIEDKIPFIERDSDADRFDDLLPSDPHNRRLMKLSRRVCLIRREEGTESTGFLLGPDLMMTTAHSLLGTSGIFVDPAKVRILFDQFVWDEEKQTMAQGAECGLRPIPFTNQPDVVASSIRVDPKSRRVLSDNRLDYVLVRLDRLMGLEFLPFSHRIRGWHDGSVAKIPAMGPVFVVQHPLGGLQKFAKGEITAQTPSPEFLEEFGNLFRYQTTTFNGASGSPIYDEYRRVVGMHIGESDSQQLGVSFQDIFTDLQEQKVTLPSFRLRRGMMDALLGTSEVERQRKAGKDWRGDRLFDGIPNKGNLSVQAEELTREAPRRVKR